VYVRDGCVNMDVASYWEGGELVCMSEMGVGEHQDRCRNVLLVYSDNLYCICY
jgi:hypothetical protein